MKVNFFRQQIKRTNTQNTSKKQKTRISSAFRYNVFRANDTYSCIRPGIVIHHSPDSIREQLTEQHLFIFCHYDGWLERGNSTIPKYVGVLCVMTEDHSEPVFVHPLHADFVQMYSERTDENFAWSLCEDNTPYWVDIYATRSNKKK